MFARKTSWTGLALCVAIFASSPALAQSSSELAGARKLFSEAIADEDSRRFAVALEKYLRVQKVRDTVQVRYRIASSLEGLGRWTGAIEAYEGVKWLKGKGGGDPAILVASKSRVEALKRRLAHLQVSVSGCTVGEPSVAVDDHAANPTDYGNIALDPGAHRVSATCEGMRPFERSITLQEGAALKVEIAFEPASKPAPVAEEDSLVLGVTPAPPSDSVVVLNGPHSAGAPTRVHPYRSAGFVTAFAGVAVGVVGIILLADRSAAISDINASCPNGACPVGRRDELQGLRDRALLEGPLGISLVAIGTAAVGVGVGLAWVSRTGEQKTSVSMGPHAHSLAGWSATIAW